MYMLAVAKLTSHACSCFVFIGSPESVIGFARDNHWVTEGVDDLANLTVELISGQLEQEVVIELGIFCPNQSATSMLICYIFFLTEYYVMFQ